MYVALAVIGLLLLLLLAGALCEQILTAAEMRRNPAPGQMIDLGTHQLHLRTLGTTGPVVVLEAGAGSPGLVWALVAREASRSARVVIVDRAGYGWSQPGPGPRTSERAVAELKLALAMAGIAGPYILVGHSFGGLTMRVFASQHPELVAGLVLVDATHEDELTDRFPAEHIKGQRMLPKMMRMMTTLSRVGVVRLLARLGALGSISELAKRFDEETGRLLISQSIRSTALATSASEMGSIEESYRQARQGGTLGDLPLVVLVHGKPGPVAPGTSPETAAQIEELMLTVAQEMAQLSTRGRLVLAAESGHEIQITEPHLVVEAIQAVATAVA